jgi:hypothetical protein
MRRQIGREAAEAAADRFEQHGVLRTKRLLVSISLK